MGLSDELSKFIPKDFGKKKKQPTGAASAAAIPTKERQPSIIRPHRAIRSHSDGDIDGDRDASTSLLLPLRHHIQLTPSTTSKHSVSTLAWDSTGDLLYSGTHQGQLHLWDFASMDSTLHPTGTVHPYEEGQRQQIRMARFSRPGTHLLVCSSGDARAKLLDRGGRQVREFKRGDMYVRDMRRTTGHVAPVTCVDWNPRDSTKFISAAADSTVRLWNSEVAAGQEQVIVCRSKTGSTTAGGRLVVSSCVYSVDGAILGTAFNGTLALWSAGGGSATRPLQQVDAAHMPGDSTVVRFLPDSRRVLTRSGSDHMVKLWDTRMLVKPLACAPGMYAAGEDSDMALSPSARHLLVGLGSPPSSAGSSQGAVKAEMEAKLAVLDTGTLDLIRTVSVPDSGSIINVLWHPRLNQIAASSSTGSTHIFYNNIDECGGIKGGATLCANKRPSANSSRRNNAEVAAGQIITPHALPLFREDAPVSAAGAKRRREAQRAKLKPGEPVYGHGHGGSIGVNETQHLMKSIMKDTLRDEDPREVLLRYAGVAEAEPVFIATAYNKDTQGGEPGSDQSDTGAVPEMKRRK
ncbi:WD40-repeat-containing domain protein [Kickxella alabastrina]|uniref:WD40-repeat-containing domain protein n=1 Tax=Kickxella alabastrina TaxID=61397 RepID=UPI00222125BC|nr:WD40-repeat-containing domain protein [Kickxella alabastrina]KAI7830060.1 WD40-repeat-containing domain protein [Kickxella alabastrina]